MMDDLQFYDAAMRRILRIAYFVGAIGVATMFAARGWRDGIGFLAGSIISLVNFRWWKRLVDGIGSSGAKTGKAWAVFFGVRYLVLAAVVYVIVRYLEISLIGVVAGLFVAIAAVVVEVLYELIFS